MRTAIIASGCLLAFLFSDGLFTANAYGSSIDVLIIGNDEELNVLSTGLSAFDDFRSIDIIDWSTQPDPTVLSGYDAVIITERYKPVVNSSAWGNIIADYAFNGGGVTLGFAFYESDGPIVDYGRLELASYNPFTRGPRVSEGDSIGNLLIPEHPLLENIEELTTEYRYDISANPGSVVVALFNDGVPLAGYLDVGTGRVVGIQAHYNLNPYFYNSGDYMQLYRNAVVTSVVPEPSVLTMLAISFFMVISRCLTKRNGSQTAL